MFCFDLTSLLQVDIDTDRAMVALVHNSRSRSIIALHPEIRGPA